MQISYKRAVNKAADETGIFKENFPTECPWTFDQITNDEFFPDWLPTRFLFSGVLVLLLFFWGVEAQNLRLYVGRGGLVGTNLAKN